MSDPVIQTFAEEFDRFHGLLGKLIDACPDNLWTDNTGNLPFWVHLLHAIGSVERYAAPFDAPKQQIFFPHEVTIFKARPDRVMSKDEMRSLAKAMEKVAYDFFATQSAATLTQKNETMSRSLGKDRTNLDALIALARHPNYHLGCCDTVLRANGLPGVY